MSMVNKYQFHNVICSHIRALTMLVLCQASGCKKSCHNS